MNLDRVAEQAHLSRVTLWRQGVTKEGLITGLLDRLAEDYRQTMWPILTSPEDASSRLKRALDALCDVIDRHLALLLTSDTVFHRAPVHSVEPFARILRDGIADGSLHSTGDPNEVAEALFNTVCWSYVHMRGRHDWPREKGRSIIMRLVLWGVTNLPSPS